MLRRIGGEVKTTVAEAQWACCFAFPSLFFVGWPCGAKAAIALLRVEYYFGVHWLSNTWHGRFATGTDEGVRPYSGARLCRRWRAKALIPTLALPRAPYLVGLVLASRRLAAGM